MPTEDFIIDLFCRVDDTMGDMAPAKSQLRSRDQTKGN